MSGVPFPTASDFTSKATELEVTSSSTDAMPDQALKRHASREENDEPPTKKRLQISPTVRYNLSAISAAAAAVDIEGKSPVSVLNELGTHVVYKIIDQSGPPHCPSFTISVTTMGLTLEGWGRSKREARTNAARACLAALTKMFNQSPAQHAPLHACDFTADIIKPQNNFHADSQTMCISPPEPIVDCSTPPAPEPRLELLRPAPVQKSPINALYEAYSDISFNCTYGDGTPLTGVPPMMLGHSQRFKVLCRIEGKDYDGYGSSKKMAKLAAARAATAALLESGKPVPRSHETWTPTDSIPQTLADHIGKLVTEKFQHLMKHDPLHAKRKVLAGVVVTTENQLADAKVIAVTTGTKCISGEHMSMQGLAINDCHAEVVARRCFQRYLYDQLYVYAQSNEPSRPIDKNELEPLPGGGYRLKPHRRVHLYVSTAPCGDGRIFSPHEELGTEPDKHPNRMARGQLRTKIESGEGTIPVKNSQNEIQTWDGVMQGERLLTMSCSDKLARWCVVGLQGALLSSHVEPVYYHSVVLGSLLHQQHLYRAMCGRIEGTLEALPPPFRLQAPLLARAASAEVRTSARAPSFSVNWCADRQGVEVVNAATGKLDSGAPSMLCKQRMFARWRHIASALPPLAQTDESGQVSAVDGERANGLCYDEVKQLNAGYQTAKERLVGALVKANLGRWVKKPPEAGQFECVDAAPAAVFS